MLALRQEQDQPESKGNEQNLLIPAQPQFTICPTLTEVFSAPAGTGIKEVFEVRRKKATTRFQNAIGWVNCEPGYWKPLRLMLVGRQRSKETGNFLHPKVHLRLGHFSRTGEHHCDLCGLIKVRYKEDGLCGSLPKARCFSFCST
jgi:hypothetical protein